MLTLALSLVAFAPSPTQDAALPFEVRAIDTATGRLELSIVPEAVRELAQLERAGFASLPLPGAGAVEVALERLKLPEIGFQVDGVPAPHLLAGLDLSVWMGSVVGEEGSQVALSISQAGLQGWVLRDGTLAHLMSDGDSIWFVAEGELEALGMTRQESCLADELPGYDESVARMLALPHGAAKAGGAPPLYGCSIALETDWQLHQVFNQNLGAQTAYVTSLITWVAYRYEEQVGTQLTYPYVQLYTTSNDPWSSQDSGGNSVDLLYEFQAAWQFNVPAGAQLGAFLSGAGLGGGVAWLPGLCNSPYNFSVSGNINGNVSFPVQVSPANWDFMVLAHEIGHNFGSPHSHDYCPPLDECAPNGYFGQCQNQQQCTTQGTLMSYCHLCPGGLSNVTTYFHTANAADMRAWVEATCLPLYAADPTPYCTPKVNSQLCVPSIGWNGHPTLIGLDDFVVAADQVLNNKVGIAIYGTSAASLPFQGGTLCVGGQIERSDPLFSGGNVPPDDCSGVLTLPWTHADLDAPGLGAGVTVYT
ncbi:MAG TPA: zinc-dependent metalloprotease, partial [Planctomycetota bacterium]|nr:zinc-dependent metalloprotease [Planctomycetota bacterium]